MGSQGHLHNVYVLAYLRPCGLQGRGPRARYGARTRFALGWAATRGVCHACVRALSTSLCRTRVLGIWGAACGGAEPPSGWEPGARGEALGRCRTRLELTHAHMHVGRAGRARRRPLVWVVPPSGWRGWGRARERAGPAEGRALGRAERAAAGALMNAGGEIGSETGHGTGPMRVYGGHGRGGLPRAGRAHRRKTAARARARAREARLGRV